MLFKNKFVALGLMLSLFTSVAFAEMHSSSHEKKIEKLIGLVHMDKLIEQQADVLVTNLTQKPPFVNHEKELKQLFLEIMDYDFLKEEMKMAYLNTFSESEIEGLIQFYQSALGQKILHKTPELTQQVIKVAQKNIEKNNKKIQDLVVKIALQEKERQK